MEVIEKVYQFAEVVAKGQFLLCNFGDSEIASDRTLFSMRGI